MSSSQPQGAYDLDFTFRFRDCKRPNEVVDLKFAFPPKAVISSRRTKRRFGHNERTRSRGSALRAERSKWRGPR